MGNPIHFTKNIQKTPCFFTHVVGLIVPIDEKSVCCVALAHMTPEVVVRVRVHE